MIGQQEVAGRHPTRRHLLGRRSVESGLHETLRDRLAGSLGVGVQQVEGPDRIRDRVEVAPVLAAGRDEPVDDRDQEGPGPARGLDQTAAGEISVGCVADEVEDQLDDPAPGEYLAVVGARVSGEFSQGHRDLDQGQLTWCSHDDHLRTYVRS